LTCLIGFSIGLNDTVDGSGYIVFLKRYILLTHALCCATAETDRWAYHIFVARWYMRYAHFFMQKTPLTSGAKLYYSLSSARSFWYFAGDIPITAVN